MITRQLFDRIFLVAGLSPRKYNLVRHRAELLDAMNRILPKYGISTHLRVSAFFANCGIETDYFKTSSEYASGADYEGRRDLGNTQAGDGRRFKGRGLTQTTGRYNYGVLNKTVGARLGINFLIHPERLNEIEIAVESACIFWQDHNLNDYADRKEFKQLSGIVNRGDKNKTPLHWAKRNELYSKCIRYIPRDFSFAKTVPSQPPTILPLAVDANNNSVVLTPTEPDKIIAAAPDAVPSDQNKDDSFLAAAFDKNVSADEARTMARSALPSLGARVWKFVAKPLMLIYAALEAGNVAAWLGVVVTLAIVAYVVYQNRAWFKPGIETMKRKFTQ